MPFRCWGPARAPLLVLPPGSGAGGYEVYGSLSGLADEAGHIESTGQEVGDDGCLGAAGPAEAGGVLHSPAGLAGVAALGVALAPHAQFPGRGTHLQVPGQADVPIGEGEVDGDQAAQGTLGVSIGTVNGWVGRLSL